MEKHLILWSVQLILANSHHEFNTTKCNNSDLIRRRENRIRSSIAEIMSSVKNIFTKYSKYYIPSLLLSYESVILNNFVQLIVMLLSNLSKWDISELNISCNNGLNQILAGPSSTRNDSLYLGLGIIPFACTNY